MNKNGLWVTLLSAGMVAAVACGAPQSTGDDDEGAGATGGSTAMSSTTSTAASTPTSSSSGGITGTGGSGAGTPESSICDSELGYPSAALNDCITANCCTEFNPCAADTACTECLTSPTATGCDTNALYQAYLTCKDGQCPTGMCDTPVGFTSNGDPLFACNACGATNCCTELNTCVGDGSDPAVDLCIDCLNDPDAAACSDATIKAAAEGFNTCIATNCANECPSG